MRFEETKYFSLLPHYKVEFSFGNFYFCENFVLSEVHEDTHFDWDKILELIGAVMDYYGEGIEIAYITNRVDSYSFEPQLWSKFHKEFDFLIAIATVAYNDFAYMNSSIEKQFAHVSLKRCADLNAAIGWIKNLKEFN